ncbi:MAG: type IV pilin protein [Sinimarinibacterium sp.]
MRKRSCGFSLIELMIAVAIVGILAAIALPSYQNSVRKSRRADAKVALTDTAQRLERCLTQYGTYDNGNCTVAAAFDSPEAYYTISTNIGRMNYTLTATAQGQQLRDEACARFTLDNRGAKTAFNGDGAAATDCW